MDESRSAAVDEPGSAVVAPADGVVDTPATVESDDGDYLVAPAVPSPADAAARTTAQDGPDPADAAEAPADGAADTPPDAPSSAPPPTDRVRPLHDPDPYSTPPYGEPGPWAPAPPVQHPGATPAQGTPIPPLAPPPPTATPAHGTFVPGGTPAHGTHLPGMAPPQIAPAHGAPIPAGTPAHGTPVPAAGPPVPAPTQTPASSPVPAPFAEASAPPYGSDPRFAPHPGEAARLPEQAPAGADPTAQAMQAGQPGNLGNPEHPGPSGPSGPSGHPGQPQTAPPPRRPYDPWNVPLQQNGAVPGQGRRRGRRGAVTGVVLVALLAGLLGGALGSYLERSDGDVGDVTLPQAGPESKHRAPGSVAGIAASALPSVVTIHVSGDQEQDTGTGFVLDGKGHILTNNHVIKPAGSDGDISVTFSGGQSAEAEVIGHDAGYDLAVIKVSGVHGLKPLPLGNSDNVQVGDPVVAIGAPFDLANTVTSGIISAKERPITTAGSTESDGSDVSYVDALQTDAPINPGNSGGPLVDSKARVIGINSAIRSADGGEDPQGGQSGSIGLGFAIPVNQAKRVAEELINTGSATHPVIGVTLDMGYTGDGARVGDGGNDGEPAVTKGGPADKAGIRAGDVITQVDGEPVHSGEELIVKIRAHRPGDKLNLTLRHGGAADQGGGDGGGGKGDQGGSGGKVTLVLGAAKGD